MAAPRLIAIPISHFCEKARWALERAGIEYVEERHLQGFHHFYALRAGGGLTTPVLRFDDGRALSQSSEIMQWVDTQLEPERRLYPAELASRVRTVEHWLDVTLGPDGRAWLYGQILDSPQLIETYGLDGIPDFERRARRAIMKAFKPYLAVRVRLQGTNADIASVRGIYDEIAGRLEDGRPYLFGDRFTAADLTFAALSASIVLPDRYGVQLPPLDELPVAMRAVIEELREHPAGQFALRVIETERPWPRQDAPVASAVG